MGFRNFRRDGYQPLLHRFALLTAAVAVFLIVAGATVTSTGSGDAVPDWPLSYGSLNPPMIGGIFYEHGHRLIAGFTGILVAILALLLWRNESRKYVRYLGYAALIGVVVQATLGGLRVLLISTESVQDAAFALTGASVEPTRIAVSVTHAFLAQSLLCALFAIVLFTSRKWIQWQNTREFAESLPQRAKTVSIVLTVTIFLQLVIGALVRHTQAGLAIPDFPLAFGQFIPPFGNLPNNPNAPFPLTDGEVFLKVLVHYAHRLVGFLIFGLVTYLYIKYRKSPIAGKFYSVLMGLTSLQIILGGINIWSGKSVLATIPHVVVGALILASSILVSLWVYRMQRGQSKSSASVKNLPEHELVTAGNS